jgi:hypothetical protein
MKKILLFGAGKSATSLIQYLITVATERDWRLVVAENNLSLAESKIGAAPCARAVAVNVAQEEQRDALVGRPISSFRCCRPLCITRWHCPV